MSDIFDDEKPASSLGRMFSFAQLWSDFRTYYLLLFTMIVISLGGVLAYTALMPAAYTATAIVGPADNSDQPFSEGLGMGGGLGGIAKHLHVGGALGQEGSSDPFDEYSSLLTSNRLADRLVHKDNILPLIFPEQWDAAHHRWLPRDSFFDQKIDYLKGLLRRPIKPAPDEDDLTKYFKKYLVVDSSLETSFDTVSLRYRSREGAEQLLALILREADNIIREDKRRDVAARIAYLDSALQHVSLADQKPELIAILSEQEQEMMMVESDHLYASELIDMPHAPLTPTSPSPIIDGLIAFAVSCLGWLAIVRMAPTEGFWARLLSVFALGRRRERSDAASHQAPKFRTDPLADAMAVPVMADRGAGRDPRGTPGKGRA